MKTPGPEAVSGHPEATAGGALAFWPLFFQQASGYTTKRPRTPLTPYQKIIRWRPCNPVTRQAGTVNSNQSNKTKTTTIDNTTTLPGSGANNNAADKKPTGSEAATTLVNTAVTRNNNDKITPATPGSNEKANAIDPIPAPLNNTVKNNNHCKKTMVLVQQAIAVKRAFTIIKFLRAQKMTGQVLQHPEIIKNTNALKLTETIWPLFEPVSAGDKDATADQFATTAATEQHTKKQLRPGKDIRNNGYAFYNSMDPVYKKRQQGSGYKLQRG